MDLGPWFAHGVVRACQESRTQMYLDPKPAPNLPKRAQEAIVLPTSTVQAGSVAKTLQVLQPAVWGFLRGVDGDPTSQTPYPQQAPMDPNSFQSACSLGEVSNPKSQTQAVLDFPTLASSGGRLASEGSENFNPQEQVGPGR